MKSFTVSLSVLILLAGAAISVTGAAGTHCVRYGDTLWDLSLHYYNTPFHWEDIQNANPSLAGVEYLQPGTELIIPDISGVAVSSQVTAEEFSGVYTTSGSSSGPLISSLTLATAGMVTANPPEAVGYIVELNVNDEEMHFVSEVYTGDLVAIDVGQNQGVTEETVFKIYAVGEEVQHPQTGAALGNVVRVAGVCRVIDTSLSSSVAMIEHTYIPVCSGHFLVPYTSTAPVHVMPSAEVDGIDAYVLAFRDMDLNRAYAYDVVYIDRGAEDGLRSGDIFSMYKYGHEVSSPSGSTVMTTDIPVCELIILETQTNTSSALITSISTTDLMQIGDRIELIRKQL
ncbi:MAG: LysM domain-containing protein [Candidatus Fermentibacteria bacterium]